MTTIPGPRRPSPSPSRLPRARPSVSTDLAPNPLPADSKSPLYTTTPDAINFYRSIPDGNGAEPYSNSLPSRNFDAVATRSVSSSALDPSPRSSKSIPALNAQKRSVRDLAAQFNQADSPSSTSSPPPRPDSLRSSSLPASKLRSFPPSSSSTPPLPAPLPPPQQAQQQQQQHRKLQKPPHLRRKSMEDGKKRLSRILGVPAGPASPPFAAQPPTSPNQYAPKQQQYLFGEVQGAADPRNIGYGIPRQMHRRGSEGSMRTPNPMFPRPSNLDLTAAASTQLPRAPYTADHRRSRSDLTGVDLAYATRSARPIEDGLPAHLSRAWDDHFRARGGGVTNGLSHSFPQMAADPAKHLQGDTRLRAYIGDSPPKTSPPLRSSRPRQQLSSYAQHSRTGSDDPSQQAPRTSTLQEITNALHPQRTVPRLELEMAERARNATIGLAPPSATETDGGSTDFEVDTPPTSAHPEDRRDHSLSAGTKLAQSSGRRTPSLSIQTQTAPPKPAPVLMAAASDSPTLPADSKSHGIIKIMLGDQSLLTPQTGRIPPPNIAEQARNSSSRSYSSSSGGGSSFTLLQHNERSATWSYTSPNPSSPGRITVDGHGYNAIHNIISHYEEGTPISPNMVEEVGRHVVEQESTMSPQAAVEELIREIESSRQNSAKSPPSSPFTLELSSPVRVDLNPHLPDSLDPAPPPLHPHPAHSTTSHETDIEDNGSSLNGDDNQEAQPRKDSSTLGAEDLPLLTNASQAHRASVQTNATSSSDHPSLPEIKDTGGNLELQTPDASRISMLPQFPEFVPEEFSPVATTAKGSFDRFQAVAGQEHSSLSGLSQTTTLNSGSQTPVKSPDQSTPTDSDMAHSSGRTLERRLLQRKNLICELINTEYSYLRDMRVVEDIYMGTTGSCSDLTEDDIRVIFANTAQLTNFSRMFADTLREFCRSVYVKPPKDKRPTKPHVIGERPASLATNSSGQTDVVPEGTDEERDRKTRVGLVFIDNKAAMERIYTEYLKNHDNANQRLQKLMQKERVSTWLGECQAHARDLSDAWNLDAMLIKPTQRLLRYPLLLGSILKETPKDHPDYLAIEMAHKEVVNMSHRINEAKKRSDLLKQITSPAKAGRDLDLTKPLSKAWGRRTEKFRQQVGLSDAVEDPDYLAISQKFTSQHLQLQVVMKDIEKYCGDGDDFIRQYLALADEFGKTLDVGHSQAPEIESKWRRWISQVHELGSYGWAEHMRVVKAHCIEPLRACLALWGRPQTLIKERKKRLADFGKYKSAKDKGDKMDKKLQEQGEQFIALNDTLKDELPRLYELSAKLVGEVLKNWIEISATWNSIWHRKMMGVVDGVDPGTFENIVKSFQNEYQYVIDEVTSFGICNMSLSNDTTSFLASASVASLADRDPYRRNRGGSYGDRDRNGSFENPYGSRNPSFDYHRGSGGSSINASNTTLSPNFSHPRPSTDGGRPGSTTPTPTPYPYQRPDNSRSASSVQPQFYGGGYGGGLGSGIGGGGGKPHQRLRSGSGAGRNYTSSERPPPLPMQGPNGTFFLPRTPPLHTSQATSYEAAASNAAPVWSVAPPGGADAGARYYSRNNATPAAVPTRHEQHAPRQGEWDGMRFPSVSEPSLVRSGSSSSSSNQTAVQGPAYRSNLPNVFSSAMPMSEDPPERHRPPDPPPDWGGRIYRTNYLAASLFDFRMQTTRFDSGYPYLNYDPGEIFEVIGERGELWLARNQDNPTLIGWIWERHFAKLLTEDS